MYVTTIFKPHITISYMSQLLCKGVQKLLCEWYFLAALLPNQNILPCVRYVGGKLWVSTNDVRYRKKRMFIFFQVLLGTPVRLQKQWYVEGGAYRVDISVQGQKR